MKVSEPRVNLQFRTEGVGLSPYDQDERITIYTKWAVK